MITEETVIQTDGFDILIDSIRWRLAQQRDDYFALGTVFECIRGANLITYHPNYGKQVGLPGDRMSLDYVRAVLVGYHNKSRRWLLGLHVLPNDDAEKPVFRALVRWPMSDPWTHQDEVRRVARMLAMMAACPLKIFGDEKLPAPTTDPKRSGFTGPLQPHNRERIEKPAIKQMAKQIDLPIRDETFDLHDGRHGPVLKQLKHPKAIGHSTPVFALCEFNYDQKKLKLLPPTGLLGAFMGSKHKVILYSQIYNVELRHTKVQISETRQDEDFQTEELTLQHFWEVYVTLAGESLLLIQETFKQSSELLQSRVNFVGGDKFETDSIEGVKYFRKHMAEQEKIDQHSNNTEHAAYILANAIGCTIIKTELER